MFENRTIQEKVLLEKVKGVGGEEVAGYIVYGDGAEPADDASWVKETMKRLEETFDEDTLIAIRMGCQCGYGMDEKKELVRELYSAAHNMEEFAGSEKARNAGLFAENDELYLSFPFCPCPMLANVDKLETKTWCYCTMGYSKKLFESVWGCEVEIELLKSVKMGDDMCLMKITPCSSIW